MESQDREHACFEAGIKFGTLYHQFAGTPVSPESAPSLARAMESAVENQPHCRTVSVSMDPEALAADLNDVSDYTELSGRHYEAEITVDADGVRVVARMSMQSGYPLMELVSVDRSPD